MSGLPDGELAARILRSRFGVPAASVSRFPTGLCHYVYDLLAEDGRACVVRIAAPATRPQLEGGLGWYPYLHGAGVPLPELYASELGEEYSYMLLERLPGSDLGQVYGGLSSPEKRSLAVSIAGIQASVGRLPPAKGFGYALSYEGAALAPSWLDVVAGDLARSEERIRRVGRADASCVSRARAALREREPYLRGVEPRPFLDDITTKNVIVADGALSGIVDADMVCFGDPLFALGLTEMSLRSSGLDGDYVEYWLDAMGATREQRAMTLAYSLVFCVNFLGELGQSFNKIVEFSEERASGLYEIFEELHSRITRP